MKNSIILFFRISSAVMLLACNNTTTHTVNTNDSLTKDSVQVAGKDHTAHPLDSGAGVSTSVVDTAGRLFLNRAASAGMLAVALGELSAKNGSSASVKRFGEMMVKDQADAGSHLKTVADQLRVALPDSMLTQHAHYRMELDKKKGAAFDKAYMKITVENHKADMEEFEKAAKTNNSLIRNFALQTLPVLQKQLDSANAILKKKF